MSKEQKALDEFLKEYLYLCEKLHTNMQEKMLLDGNSPYNILKQALLKSPEPFQTGIDLGIVKPKQYLKWEDLEFKEERQEIPVRMGETIYTLVLKKTDGGNKIAKLLSPKRNYMGEWGDMFYEEAKQFFNDLRLERVKE